MNDEAIAPFGEGPRACPFVAFEDDRDRRSDRPDYRHRCYASPQPEPRAYPHQERYCLAPGFVECPIFLEWARREAAVSVPARRATAAPVASAAAAAAAAAVATDEPSPSRDEAGLPGFLAGRSRPEPPPVEDAVPERTPTPEEGLWGADEEPARRRPLQPVSGTARPNAGHPSWERAPRYESYPAIRRRRSGGIPPVVVALAVVLVVAAGLFAFTSGMLPSFGSSSSQPGATATTRASGSAPASARASSSAVASASAAGQVYVVKQGDTLSGIAAKFHVTVEAILAANKQISDPNAINLGDRIAIPAPGASPVSQLTSAPSPTAP